MFASSLQLSGINSIIYPMNLLRDKGDVQQCRSTTLPKNAGNFQNNLDAFSKEREVTDANYQRTSLQFRISAPKCLQLQIKQFFGAKTSKLQIFSPKTLKCAT